MNFANNSSIKSAYAPPHGNHSKSYYQHQYRSNTKFNKFSRSVNNSHRGGFHSGGGSYHRLLNASPNVGAHCSHDGSPKTYRLPGCGFKSYAGGNSHSVNVNRNRHSRFNKFKANKFNKVQRGSPHHHQSYGAYPPAAHSHYNCPAPTAMPPPNCGAVSVL